MHRSSSLAFIPADEVPGAFQEWKPHLLEEAGEVIDGEETVPGTVGEGRFAEVPPFERQPHFYQSAVCTRTHRAWVSVCPQRAAWRGRSGDRVCLHWNLTRHKDFQTEDLKNHVNMFPNARRKRQGFEMFSKISEVSHFPGPPLHHPKIRVSMTLCQVSWFCLFVLSLSVFKLSALTLQFTLLCLSFLWYFRYWYGCLP